MGMTDLHFRLRARSQRLWVTEQDLSDNKLFREAADRIEELMGERDEALNQLDSARHSVDVLEKRLTDKMAKLAKALDGLRFVDDGANHGAMTSTYSENALRYILRGIRDRARAVLAELEKDT